METYFWSICALVLAGLLAYYLFWKKPPVEPIKHRKHKGEHHAKK